MLSWLRLSRRRRLCEGFRIRATGPGCLRARRTFLPSPPAPEDQASSNLRFVVGFLVLIVALQAYPSALWLRSGWRRSADPAAATPRAEAPASAAAASVPAATTGCEPAPPNPTVAGHYKPRSRRRRQPPSVTPLPRAAAPPPAASPQGLAGMLSVTAPVPLQGLSQGPPGWNDRSRFDHAAAGHARARVRERELSGSARAAPCPSRRARPARVKLDAPPGTLHINAVPWAEVWIDGERIGETPIGNLPARDWHSRDRLQAS